MPAIDTTMYDFSVLRELRKREGLSISEVSERSGVSPAVISKLERNKSLADLDTLYKVGRVFGMHPSDLLSLVEKQAAHKQYAGERERDGISFQDLRYGNIRCLLGTAASGARLSRPEVHGDDYEVCWVLKGQLQFELPNETHTLKSGDAIQFDAILAHAYEAKVDSQFLILRLRKEKRF